MTAFFLSEALTVAEKSGQRGGVYIDNNSVHNIPKYFNKPINLQEATMTHSALSTALFNGPATVKQLAAHIGLSESRVRELLKSYDNLQSDGGRPAKYWLEQPVEEYQDGPVCPFCGAEASDLEPAGAEGTFLGDSVLLCRKCKKAHNTFSGVEVSLPEGRKSRKGPINPQYRINKKVAAVKAAGGTLTYDRTTRLWALQLPRHEAPVLMTSREFSQVDSKTILELD